MVEEHHINCPYCGESISVLVDSSGGEQNYYEDCSVCCSPILFKVYEDATGNSNLTIKRDDE
ncbi:MAG: CPXCG motif-containing cysteine-rich protein [Methylococcaceae bacterium]|nr:CPXCG motif-containing cysteine-rich protein [Methylococcaceae bacterium]